MKKVISMVLALTLIFALSASAFAAPGGGSSGNGGDVKVNGTIKEGVYKVSYTDKVYWYVTDESSREVWNSSSNNDNTTPNKISNNSKGTAYLVTLKGVSQTNNDAKTVAKDLTLSLTGDLAAAPLANKDISGGYTNTTAYSASLTPGSWSYGFGGQYNAWLSSTSYSPTYTMTLGFAMGK